MYARTMDLNEKMGLADRYYLHASSPTLAGRTHIRRPLYKQQHSQLARRGYRT